MRPFLCQYQTQRIEQNCEACLFYGTYMCSLEEDTWGDKVCYWDRKICRNHYENTGSVRKVAETRIPWDSLSEQKKKCLAHLLSNSHRPDM